MDSPRHQSPTIQSFNPCDENTTPLSRHQIYKCATCDTELDPLDSKFIEQNNGLCVYGKCYDYDTLFKTLDERKETDKFSISSDEGKTTFSPKILKEQIHKKKDANSPLGAQNCPQKDPFIKNPKTQKDLKKIFESLDYWSHSQIYKEEDSLISKFAIQIKTSPSKWTVQNYKEYLQFIKDQENWDDKDWKVYQIHLSDYIEKKEEDQESGQSQPPAYTLKRGKLTSWITSAKRSKESAQLNTQQPQKWLDVYKKTSMAEHGVGREASVGKGEILFGQHLGLTPSGPNKSYDFIFNVNNKSQEADVKEADKDGSITTGKRGAVIARSLVSNIDKVLTQVSKVILDLEKAYSCEEKPLTCFSKYLSQKEINRMNLVVAKWINKGLHEFSQGNIEIFKEMLYNLNYMKTTIRESLKTNQNWLYKIDMQFSLQQNPGTINTVGKNGKDAVTIYKMITLMYNSEDKRTKKLQEVFKTNFDYVKFLVDLEHLYIDNPTKFDEEFEGLPKIFEGEWIIFVTKEGYWIMDNPVEEMEAYRITQGKPRFRPKNKNIIKEIRNKEKK